MHDILRVLECFRILGQWNGGFKPMSVGPCGFFIDLFVYVIHEVKECAILWPFHVVFLV